MQNASPQTMNTTSQIKLLFLQDYKSFTYSLSIVCVLTQLIPPYFYIFAYDESFKGINDKENLILNNILRATQIRFIATEGDPLK